MTLVRPFRVTPISKLVFVLVAGILAISPAAAAVCGNSVVEAGEDCDDGSAQNGGTNSCCTAACTFSGKSPDVIVGDLVGTQNYGTVSGSGIYAYSVGTTSCNLGSCWLNWISGTAEHPVIGQNLYRLKNGRFEQIGQSWLKHGFTALTGSVCATCVPPPNGSHLGVNCSDPYSSSLNGDQSRLGPKNDVNPDSGVFLFPDPRESTTGNAIYKRLQAHTVDVDPAQNSGAVYFVEGQYVTHDDALAKNNPNNASYRPVSFGNSPFNMTIGGATVRGKMGIQAWKATDSAVTETPVAAPEGLFVLSAKATSLGGGIYHYEYALQNLTNQRGAQSFSVPIPPGTVVTNVGFHDVDYHSSIAADLYDGTDWTGTVSASSVTWATTPYATNVMANALRWGTLYNFRFDANVAPGFAATGIALFKPGAPGSVTATTVAPNSCLAAANGTACTDGNGCTLTDTCQAGSCQGSTPVVCTASDSCHTAGTCSPDTGVCSNPTAPNGSTCTDGSACTQIDTCQSGVCVGSVPVVCSASDQCHNIGTCNPASGICSNPAKANGSACSDGTACTQTDTCQSGACVGGSPVVCAASDQCHDVGTCAPGTGVCSNPVKANGAACSDANPCTQSDTCQSGACTGANPVVCSASDACHTAGLCSPATGLCSNPNAPDGTSCSDANACTTFDDCHGGTCLGFSPVVCTASDVCHVAGTCAPATGICSNPSAPDGNACDDANACTTDDSCQSGACVGQGTASPGEVDNGVQVSQLGGVTTITWNQALGSTWSDVLRGLVAGLPVGPGGVDETCLVTGTGNTSATDPDTPNPDEAFWYLVQGGNDCGKGPYGFALLSGVPTPRTSTTCP
jgi:hypothetical protein